MPVSTLDVRRRVASLTRTPPFPTALTQGAAEKCPSTPPEALDEQVPLSHALRAQCTEILRHRDALSAEQGRPVPLDEAARDWIVRHAAAWRVQNDSVRTLQGSP